MTDRHADPDPSPGKKQLKIVDLLAQGDVVGGHRSRGQARQYLADFKTSLGMPTAPEPAFDEALEDFLIEAVLGAAWYQRKCQGAQRKVNCYIVLNIGLIILLPLVLVGLGKLGGKSPGTTLVGQITGVLTGILALQKTLSTWYASQVRYAVWYKAGADLKSLYYAVLQAWSGKTAADPVTFVTALRAQTEAARQIISNEQLDFYQKLTLPSFDVLDMLTSTRATVSSLVTSLIPGAPSSDVAILGKNALVSAPGGATPPHAIGPGGTIALPLVTVLSDPSGSRRPYTIVIIANPALMPDAGAVAGPDPILQQPAAYQTCVRYIRDVLFGRLANQAEQFLSPFESRIRIISIFDPACAPSSDTALVAEFPSSDIVQPLQRAFAPLIAKYKYKSAAIKADVVFAVTASPTHTRSSAYYTSDDENSGGTAFQIDGQNFVHRQDNQAPGVVALHVTADSVTALHEFSHAASSWTNGCITDLYVDSGLDYGPVNIRTGRPIPNGFCSYDAANYLSDGNRNCLGGYPAGWNSYHCELADSRFPALMDDYWHGSGRPEDCLHDKITRDFLVARLASIMARP